MNTQYRLERFLFIFRKEFGETLGEYLNRIRVSAATPGRFRTEYAPTKSAGAIQH